MRRSWSNAGAADDVRVVKREDRYRVLSTRYLRNRAPVRLSECLAYPFTDGPGVGLLLFFPPALWLLSLPVFDVIAVLRPFTKGDWALGLLVLPVFLPLLFSFVMTVGYVLLFLGEMLVASAIGEMDHPRWPEWHPNAIAEGLARWIWAFLFGAGLVTLPIAAYWARCGEIDLTDRVVITALVILGVSYAQMALAAALLHDHILAANPVTVIVAVARVGWGYVPSCIVSGLALLMIFGAASALLTEHVSFRLAAVSLWVFWIATLYASMVVMRLLGLTYYRNAERLGWFRRRPRWSAPSRIGRIYENS
ncbi:MAG: hypothetical protein P4L84_36885 [Isosphaeraceae bacterium]|nr:hypothetical protein [Isosphaeraceae bacterium]